MTPQSIPYNDGKWSEPTEETLGSEIRADVMQLARIHGKEPRFVWASLKERFGSRPQKDADLSELIRRKDFTSRLLEREEERWI